MLASISALEWAANLFTAAAIWLAGRNNVHTWWTGIVGCALFGALFFQSQLYADVLLQAFFIGTSAWGWWQWVGGRTHVELPITRAPRDWLAKSLVIGVAATLAYGSLLKHFTDAYAPFIDSVVLVASVVAQWLMMQRRLENWPVWLLVNTVAVPLYASRGLMLTAVLYAAYWVNALVAWRHWWRLMQAQAAGAPAPATPRPEAAA
jgi:nicotinamide mononucleotide transporter